MDRLTLDHTAPSLQAPDSRGPRHDNAARALRAALWLAIEAADRCGDQESGDSLLFIYTQLVKRL